MLSLGDAEALAVWTLRTVDKKAFRFELLVNCNYKLISICAEIIYQVIRCI
jgi:hypothetical protein